MGIGGGRERGVEVSRSSQEHKCGLLEGNLQLSVITVIIPSAFVVSEVVSQRVAKEPK